MRLSRFFEDMIKTYRTELEDLESDSEGKNVLRKRLAEKRSQFAQLMPMIEFAPEMVAVVFHRGMTFSDQAAMTDLSTCEPEEFPEWALLCGGITFDATTEKLAETVLAEPGGEQFMITTACLEFLHAGGGRFEKTAQPIATFGDDEEVNEGVKLDEDGNPLTPDDSQDNHDERDDDAFYDVDLDNAGADWMADQGFDRKG
jgi:hypothetical protein